MLIAMTVETEEGTRFTLVDASDRADALNALLQSIGEFREVEFHEGNEILNLLNDQYRGIAELTTL